MSEHARGVLITVLGVLFITPDTLLIRLVEMDVWTLAVWRGLLQALGVALLVVVIWRRRTAAAFRAIGWSGVGLAVAFGLATLCFLAAVLNTKVANALILISTAPFFAAVLSRVFLKERVAARTWAAIAAAFAGIGLIVAEGIGGGTLFGDGMALFCAFLLGAKFTILRGRKQVNMVPAMAVSGLAFAAVALPMALAGTAPLMPQPAQWLWLVLMGLAVIAPATALLSIGPRYIPAAEVSLFMLGETVLGPLWVWLVVDEAPSRLGLLGGAIVLAALVGNTLAALRRPRRPALAPS
jgi:drug/metabolite transporter (DMT)-like permease